MGKLTVVKVRKAEKPGLHGDGGGLYLRVKPSGAKSWVLRVQYLGKREDIGLGSITDLELDEAREKAAHLRRLARRGVDARTARDEHKQLPRTFAEAYDAALAEMSKSWADRSKDSFEGAMRHALKVLGRKRVADVTAADMIAVLEPIWSEKPQMARKVRQGMRQVLTFAKARGWRAAPVPMPDEIRMGLAKQPASQHHAAMPWRQVPGLFKAQWAEPPAPTRLALLFVILTAARQGEARSAEWSHIDLERRQWVRPARLLKARKDHVVMLSDAALAVLQRAGDLYGREGLIFPSIRKRAMLSDAALGKVLREAGRSETVHGFRSCFRDWAAEMRPDLPGDVAEMALSHEVGSKVERAYRRTSLPEMQRELMDAWGAFVSGAA
jgi:integrase